MLFWLELILFGIIRKTRGGIVMAANATIKRLRKERGLTQEQLAEQLGVSIMTVRRLEWGQTSPNTKMIADLANVLDVKPEEFLDNGDADTSVSYTKEQSRNQGMATYTNKRGERFEVPATPEGFAFLRDIALRDAISANNHVYEEDKSHALIMA